MAACAEPHPTSTDRACIHPGHERHANHNDGRRLVDSAWPNSAFVSRVPKKAPGRKNTKSALSKFLGSSDAPNEATAAWARDQWTEDAYQAVRQWLTATSETFTTAEQWWPLLSAPKEMRALSVVVKRLLREGCIEEVGAVRLRGVYTSADGVEFKENKLVPQYRSRIATN